MVTTHIIKMNFDNLKETLENISDEIDDYRFTDSLFIWDKAKTKGFVSNKEYLIDFVINYPKCNILSQGDFMFLVTKFIDTYYLFNQKYYISVDYTFLNNYFAFSFEI